MYGIADFKSASNLTLISFLYSSLTGLYATSTEYPKNNPNAGSGFYKPEPFLGIIIASSALLVSRPNS